MVRISEIQHFWKLFREISVPFDAVSKFSKVLVEWKAPSKALCFISATRYCFRNIDLARQVPDQCDVQPRIMSTVPVCLLICHENKATLFTRKLESSLRKYKKLHSPMADHGTLNALFCLNISPYMATSDSKPTGKAQSKNMNVILII